MATLTYVATPNTELNSIEVTFSGKPCEETRKAMKSKGFIWNKTKALWYIRLNHTNRFKQSNDFKNEKEMTDWLSATIEEHEPAEEETESVPTEPAPTAPDTGNIPDLDAYIRAEVAKQLAAILGKKEAENAVKGAEKAPEAEEKKPAKKSKIPGGKARRDALTRIYKNAGNANFAGRWLDDKGRECYCDGFTAVRLNEPVGAGAELVKGMDLEKVIKKPEKYTELPAPSLADLKEQIKLNKAEHKGEKGYKVKYDFGTDLPLVDASYLKNVLEIFPDACLMAESSNDEGKVYTARPIYIASKDGDGCLMPIRKTN